jgi:hypothetical protein
MIIDWLASRLFKMKHSFYGKKLRMNVPGIFRLPLHEFPGAFLVSIVGYVKELPCPDGFWY